MSYQEAYATFTGGVMSDRVKGGRCGAEITFGPGAVRAVSPDGDVFEIPFRDCKVEMGGYNGKMVFCRDPEGMVTIFCEGKRFARALSQASSGTLDESLNLGHKKRRKDSRLSLSIGLVSLVVCLLLLVGGYFALRFGAKVAVKALPVSIDQQLGDVAYKSMDLKQEEIDKPEVLEPIQAIVDQLAPQASLEGLEFKVHVVRSPQINAFCLPGGTIVVFTGLIDAAERPEQLAGVLGHEMAHATLRHGMERTAQALGVGAALAVLVGDGTGLLAIGAEVFQFATVNSYSRGQENEADAEGLRMLHESGIDPSAMAEFFEIMQHEHPDMPGALNWISTHPSHEERIRLLQQLVSELPESEYQPLATDLDQLKQAIK